MRVLWLYWNDPRKNDSSGLSRRIHYGFVTQLNKLRDVKLLVYGPGQEKPTALSPIPYNKAHSFSYLRKYLKPNIVLLYTLGNVMGWIPRDFKDAQIPKVMVECDWWYVTKKQWYEENHINLIIQRGRVDTNLSEVPSTWLPFSASEEFAKHQQTSLRRRARSIGFVGRGAEESLRYGNVYQNRFKALQLLQQQKLVTVRGVVGHEKYPDELGFFRCCFSDCGRLHSPPAKTFEIMASGTLLLTDHFKGYKRLFGDKVVCKFYNRNRKDLVETARNITNGNTRELQVIVDTAVEEINNKHLDKHRIVELASILKGCLNNTVVKKWGI